ncbi:MAG: nitrate reductase molybdenum cofactor assembly chaperone [Candidatus Nanopelagicales bacterium]
MSRDARDELTRRTVFAAVSRLLRYPDEELVEDLPVLRRTVADLPRSVGDPLLGLVGHLEVTPLLELQRSYVSTFDLKRRCCLYLTYYLNGDTRRRGMALWRFAETYRRTGLRLESGELPDFLPVLLEYAVVGDGITGLGLLVEHREGLEVLRQALRSLHSPYAGALDALCRVLPEMGEEELAAALRLAAEGPPAELVGVAPMAPFGVVDAEGADGLERVAGARA